LRVAAGGEFEALDGVRFSTGGEVGVGEVLEDVEAVGIFPPGLFEKRKRGQSRVLSLFFPFFQSALQRF
jgi:hypothetical protein